MPRTPRTFDPNGTYHIIGRGNNKSLIFHDENDYKTYLYILLQTKSLYNFYLYHFVLMPNHVHLLLKPNSDKLSHIMHAIQMNYARYFCKKYNFIGHVWQGRFKNVEIKNDAQLLSCGNYIEMNPVRAGLIVRPETWQWSSYRFYAFGEENDLVDPDPLFEFPTKNNQARFVYQATLIKTRATY